MANNLLSVWTTIGSVILAILILLAMITVHEFGHYLAGKILKFKIDEFSVGFGPAFFKIKRKKSGEIFAVRLIPLGGYCAFHGEDGLEDEEEKHPFFKRKKKVEEEPFQELSKEGTDTVIVTPPAEKPIPMSGESASQTPSADTLPMFGEDAMQAAPPAKEGVPMSAEEVSQAQAAPAKKPSRGELWTEDGAFTSMKPWKRLIVLVAGAFMNYVLAFLLILLCFSVYGQGLVRVKAVAEPTEEFTADYSFRAGDILLQADGASLYLTTDIARAVNGKHAGDLVKFRVGRTGEDGALYEEEITIMLRSDVSLKNSAVFTGVWGALGVGIEERGDAKYYTVENATYRFGFFETIGRSFVYSFKIAGSIFRVIGELFTGRIGINSLGGPVTTITTTTQVVSTGGFRGFLEIAAFIGVKKLKWHPVAFIAISAVIGILLKF